MQSFSFKKALPIILLGAGALFVAFHVLVNAPAWIKSAFTKIEHPTTYRFATYDKLLHEVVKGNGVDYAALKKSPLLDKAVDELSVVASDKLSSDKEKVCYWLNAYNMLMLKSLSDRYPISSPRKLGNSLSFRKFTIGGDTYSVRDIVDLKLDPYFKRNPVLTFVMCEGAKGDPALLDHALLPESVVQDAQKSLDNFVNEPANTKYDEVADVFFISPYFQRYDEYFAAYYESAHMLAASHMKKSVPATNVSLLKRYTRNFDWRLNDVEAAAPEQPKHSDSKQSETKQSDIKQSETKQSDNEQSDSKTKENAPNNSKNNE